MDNTYNESHSIVGFIGAICKFLCEKMIGKGSSIDDFIGFKKSIDAFVRETMAQYRRKNEERKLRAAAKRKERMK